MDSYLIRRAARRGRYVQPPRYLPTEAEIRQMCLMFQAGWSEEERILRAAGDPERDADHLGLMVTGSQGRAKSRQPRHYRKAAAAVLQANDKGAA